MPLCTCGSHQRPVCRNKFSSSAIRDLGMPLPTELALQHVIKLFHLVLGIKPRCLCKLSVHFTTVQPNIIVCLFGFGFLCFFLSLSLFDPSIAVPSLHPSIIIYSVSPSYGDLSFPLVPCTLHIFCGYIVCHLLVNTEHPHISEYIL